MCWERERGGGRDGEGRGRNDMYVLMHKVLKAIVCLATSANISRVQTEQKLEYEYNLQ